jgi:hypothetical protein
MRALRSHAIRVSLYRVIVTCMVLLFAALNVSQVPAYAISQDALNSIVYGTPFYDPDADSSDCSSGVLPATIPSWGSQIFTNAANQYNVPPALVATIYWREHGGSWEEPPPPYGNGPTYASSGVGPAWPADGIVGAAGPFQFEYSTWLGYINANPAHQINPNDTQAVILSAEDLTDAAYGAAEKLADLGGTTTAQIGNLSNTLQPNTIVNAIRAYNEGAAATDPDLAYVTPALNVYLSLTGSNGSCNSSGFSVIGVCNDLEGEFSSTWPPLCPWVPQGGYPAAQAYGQKGVAGSDWGQCTWWAAYNESYNAGGNGSDWYGNAQFKGMPTQPPSAVPEVGEAVSYNGNEPWIPSNDKLEGHVAVVIAVDTSNHTYTVSNGNWNGVGNIHSTTFTYPDPYNGIVGFIGPDPNATQWIASHNGGS